MSTELIVRELGLRDYISVWNAMREFTQKRSATTQDELWLVEHHPIFTLGQAGKAEHILQTTDIPIVRTDRGGQVTFHGPGQVVGYVLLDLRRKKIGIRPLVALLEQVIIDLLADYQIVASNRCDAPGVYIEGEKICSIGLRVKQGCTYHGFALNVDLDLKPFKMINPCGFSGLKMTQLSYYQKQFSKLKLHEQLVAYMVQKLGYTSAHVSTTENNERLLMGVHNG